MVRGRRGARNLTGDAGKARSAGGRAWRGRRLEDTFGDGEEWQHRREIDWTFEAPRRRSKPRRSPESSQDTPPRRDTVATTGKRGSVKPAGKGTSPQESKTCRRCRLVLPATGICDGCTG